MKRLVIDVDGTLTLGDTSDYTTVSVNCEVANKIREYRKMGFEIVLHTSRNMRTYESSIGKITAKTLPILFDWLKENDIPYDEIWVGKPWCGNSGFYVDDKAVRPDEFSALSYDEIRSLLKMPAQKE